MAVGLTLMDENREQYSQFTHTWTLAHATHAPTHACTRTHALLKGKFNTYDILEEEPVLNQHNHAIGGQL